MSDDTPVKVRCRKWATCRAHKCRHYGLHLPAPIIKDTLCTDIPRHGSECSCVPIRGRGRPRKIKE